MAVHVIKRKPTRAQVKAARPVDNRATVSSRVKIKQRSGKIVGNPIKKKVMDAARKKLATASNKKVHAAVHKELAPTTKSIQQRRSPAQIKKAAEGRVRRAKAETNRVATDKENIDRRAREKRESRQGAEDIFQKAFRSVTGRKKKRKK